MRTFNPIHRDFVAPADLETLGKTYNTLEQGHKEAVRTASELEIAMANLDLNEAESEWRQQKIDDIRTTIQSNTLHGNSYAALDDLVTKAGNIASDAGMIGRLNAQKDHKEYLTNLANRKDITEEYKEYYREMNPYFYEDKVNTDGRIIGGTKWNPLEREVGTVPLSDIIVKGIQIAAKEKGGGTNTRWINSSGQVTTDPSQAFDGEIYNSSTNQWERLSKEKIMQGITSMIESTPGAKASLEQDYKIAKWKYGKQGDVNPDVTDKNGMVLSFNDYIMKQIDPAVQAASFYNSTNSTTYGAGLKTYKAAQRAAANAAQESYYKANNYTTDSTPITVNYDYAGNLQAQKQNAANTLYDVYKKLTGKDIDVEMGTADPTKWRANIEAAKEEAKAKGLPNSTIAELDMMAQKGLRSFTEASNNYNQIASTLTPDQKNAMDFVSRMNSGAGFDTNNPYDDKFMKATKRLFTDDTQSVRATFNDDNAYKTALGVLSGGDKSGYKVLGYKTGYDKDGKPYIELPRENYNQAYLFSTAVNAAYDTTGFFAKGWQNMKETFGSKSRDVYVARLDANGNKVTKFKGRTSDVPTIDDEDYAIYGMKNIVDTFESTNKKVQQSIKEQAPATITFDNKSMRFATFTEAETFDQYQGGQIDRADYNIISKIQTDELKNKIVNHDFAMTDMFLVQDSKGASTLKREVESSKRKDAGIIIQTAAANGQAQYSAAHNPVYGTGTNVTVFSKYDSDGKPKGEPTTYFIPGLVLEEAADKFANSSTVKANDKIAIGNEIKQTYIFNDPTTNPSMGTQSIKCLGGNNFIYSNGVKEYSMNRTSAVNVAKALEDFNDIKDGYKSGFIFTGAQTEDEVKAIQTRAASALQGIATTISNNTDGGQSTNLILQQMLNDLEK